MTKYEINQQEVKKGEEFELPDNMVKSVISRKDIAGRDTRYVVDYLMEVEEDENQEES